MPTNGLLVLPLIFGLVIGSFLNVLVYRLPRELSIINPGSFCPKCKNKITFYRNIPLLSYIMQKGRCAYCNDRISIRYPLIELATGVIWFFSFLNYQISVATPFALFVTILLAISVIDAEFLIIPFSLLLSGLVVIVIDTVIHPKMIMDSIYGVLFGFAYLGSIMLITKWIFKKQTMGYGDLLLVVILGAWVGSVGILLSIFLSAIIGLIAWLIVSVIQGFKREMPLPFAPFLSLSAVITKIIDFDILKIFG